MRARVVSRLLMPAFTLATVSTLAALGVDQGERAFRAGNRFLDISYFADAVKMYTRALERNPYDATVYYNRALANEMVNRKAAIGDWARFLELAGTNPEWQAAASRVRVRLQELSEMPAVPTSLQPSAYVPKAGDYYQEVAQSSAGLQFSNFPVKVFVGNVPEEWQRTIREAIDDWNRVLPLKEVASREGADIVVDWGTSVKESHRAGWERDWVQEEQEGTHTKRTKVAFIGLDASHRWSEDQRRSTVAHEIGHALGIQGHSGSPRDVMFSAVQEILNIARDWGPIPSPSAVELPPPPSQKPSQRDINTLLRLYNTPGFLPRLGN